MSQATAYPSLDLSARHLDVSRVWGTTSDAFSQATRNFVLLGLLTVPAAIAAAIPLLLAQSEDTLPFALSAGFAILQVLLLGIGQNATVYGVGRLRTGETFAFGDALAVGCARLPQWIGASVLSALVILVGLALLVVPGLIALVALSLVGGACVLEHRGPLAAMRRSVELAKGNLWRIVGAAALVVGVPVAAILGVGGTLVGVFYAMHTEFSLVVTVGLAAIIAVLAATIIPAISMVFTAALFLELRHLKEST